MGFRLFCNWHHLNSLLDNYPPSSLELTFPFQTVSSLQSALEQAYGPRGGRGVGVAYWARLFQIRSKRIWIAIGSDGNGLPLACRFPPNYMWVQNLLRIYLINKPTKLYVWKKRKQRSCGILIAVRCVWAGMKRSQSVILR